MPMSVSETVRLVKIRLEPVAAEDGPRPLDDVTVGVQGRAVDQQER